MLVFRALIFLTGCQAPKSIALLLSDIGIDFTIPEGFVIVPCFLTGMIFVALSFLFWPPGSFIAVYKKPKSN